LLYNATDQGVLYIVVAGVWVWLTGVMSGLTVGPDQRPALAAGDVGFLFYGTNMLLMYRWNGAAYIQFPPDASITQPGIVNTSAQEFNGVKTFDDGIIVDADIELSSTSTWYVGAPATDGTWKIVRSGTDLQISRREAGVYVVKATIVA